MPLPALLRRFLIQSVGWTALCVGTEMVCRFLLHWPYPYNYPAMPRSVMFGDFHDYVTKFGHFHSREFFAGPPLTYPAPAAVLYRLFVLDGGRHVRTATYLYVGVALLIFLVAAGLFAQSLIHRGLAPRSARVFAGVTLLLSFPIWFELHQGNIEAMVWVLTSLGLWALWTSRPWWAAVLLGIAAATKLFPFLLLALFLPKQMYRQAAVAVLTAASVTLASLWIVCPDVIYSVHATRFAMGELHYAVESMRSINLGFDHGLFGLLKSLLPATLTHSTVKLLAKGYVVLAAVVGLVVYVARIRHLPLANQMICLSVLSVLLPPVSYDYTLIHLTTALVLCSLAALEGEGREIRGLGVAFSMLAFAWSFQSELIVHGVRVAGQCKTVALLALLAVMLRYPLQVTPMNERRAELQGG